MQPADPPVTALVDDRFDLCECPVWDHRRGRLLWCAINRGEIHALHLDSGERALWRFEEPVGSFGLCESGRFVVALRASVVLFDPATEDTTVLATVAHENEAMRLNDGKVGPDGAFWVGSMNTERDRPPTACLYRVTRDGEVSTAVEGLGVSNGLAWSPAGDVMYHTDTRGPWIDRWDFDPASGWMSNRTRLATLDEASGRPDGGATDAEGFYWSAGVSAGCLNRFAPDGTLDRVVALPVPRPTMPCFGGQDLRTLFVTSLTGGIALEVLAAHPLSGAVLTLPAPVSGSPVARFRD